ncbi:tigger transposable element-derived protein 4-like [Ischnura elegans]|uniref:tigger transposable element-derived protein 4-like n=1 Tax=Ischnura elegans TaxID=197161 RepID=UPI001ED89D95|nr:tigger transposable element-derived protein 4-like [Ischnura elegans]
MNFTGRVKYLSITSKTSDKPAEKVSVIKEVEKGVKKKSEIAKDFGIPPNTLSTYLKNKYKILSSAEEFDKDRKRSREPGNPDVDNCVLKWFKQTRDKKVPVSGPLIRIKAEQFAKELGKQNFKASTGWLDDEKCHGGKLSKERITLLVGAYMDGSEKLPLLMIGKSANPRCFKNVKSKPVEYVSSSKAWMTSDLFAKWLMKLDKRFVKENRQVLLFIDNCTAHNTIPVMENVKVVFFAANMTSVVQPMDQGIIKNLKHFYRGLLVENILSGEGNSLKIKLDILEASRMCKQAWDKVKPETIKNCFKKAGFVKTDEESAERTELDEILPIDGWEDVAPNPIILYEDFLNVDENVAVCGELTDADIVAEVLDTETQNNEGSGDEIEGSRADEEETPVPSAADAMDYLREIRRFVESRNNVVLYRFLLLFRYGLLVIVRSLQTAVMQCSSAIAEDILRYCFLEKNNCGGTGWWAGWSFPPRWLGFKSRVGGDTVRYLL